MGNLLSCNFMGGLGNQLFEAAHVLSQGWKHNREVVFKPNSWTPGQGNDVTHYLDTVFRNLRFTDNLEGFRNVDEITFEYCEINPLPENTVFSGYYQSTKNWFGYDDKVREMFQPPTEFVEQMYSKHPQLLSENTLSLHVRRSEYLQFPQIHPTITKEYIIEALKLVGEYSTVFVFSDDHEWVKENLGDILSNIVYVNEEKDWMELWLMGLCKNHIISNSTFSWWGSFLNKNKHKKIVAPSLWFGPKGPNGKDIYESYWSLVNVKLTDDFKLLPI